VRRPGGRYAEAVALWSAGLVQNEAAGLADSPGDEHAREQPLRDARQALGERQFQAANDRGAAMTLACMGRDPRATPDR